MKKTNRQIIIHKKQHQKLKTNPTKNWGSSILTSYRHTYGTLKIHRSLNIRVRNLNLCVSCQKIHSCLSFVHLFCLDCPDPRTFFSIPLAMVRGFTDESSRAYGVTYDFRCRLFYTLYGDGRIECLKNSSWNNVNISCKSMHFFSLH